MVQIAIVTTEIETIVIAIIEVKDRLAPRAIMARLITGRRTMALPIAVLPTMFPRITVLPITAHHDMNRAPAAHITVAPAPVRIVDVPTKALHVAGPPTIVPRIEIAE